MAFQDYILFFIFGWHALVCVSDRFPLLILSCVLGCLNLGKKRIKKIFKYLKFNFVIL